MNKREKEILNIILATPEKVSIKKLSEICGVTERSVRYSLENMNEKLGDNNLPKLVLGGMGSVYLEDKREFLNRYSEDPPRDMVLLLGLIFHTVIKLTHLSRELGVSSSTLKRDLNTIEKSILPEGLEMKFIPGMGISLEGDELKIRNLGINYLSKNHMGNLIRRNTFIGQMKKYIGIDEENFLRSLLKRIEKQVGGKISDEAFDTIHNYLMITVSRLRMKKRLKNVKNSKFLSETYEYLKIKEEIIKVKKTLGVDFPEEEILQVTDYIAGAHGYGFKFSYYDNWIANSINIKKLIASVGKKLREDLKGDEDLFEGLLNHIKPALYRLKNGISLNNSIYNEVKDKYLSIMDAVEVSLEELYRDKGIVFTRDEIAFISLHFKTSLDKIKKQEDERKRIIFVCNYGIGSSRLLANLLADTLMIDVVSITPYYQLEEELKIHKDIHLIISTMDISKTLNIDVIRVEAIPTDDDVESLVEMGIKRKKKELPLSNLLKVIEKHTTINNRNLLVKELMEVGKGCLIHTEKKTKINLRGYLPLERIIVEKGRYHWEDAIGVSCVPLIMAKLVTYDYAKGIVDAVEEYGSYMVVSDLLAIPHFRDESSDIGTGMALTVYREPVIFPDEKKARVFLTFSSSDNREHLGALTEFINIFEREGIGERIADAANEVEIYELLTKNI